MNTKINITVRGFKNWQKESANFPYDHIVIGYRTPGINYPEIQFSQWCKGHIEIPVHDVGVRDKGKGMIEFNNNHAKQILELFEKEKNNIFYVVCQCDAGISRSSATAAALSKIHYGTDEWVFSSPYYVPNMCIYSTILQEYYEGQNGK